MAWILHRAGFHLSPKLQFHADGELLDESVQVTGHRRSAGQRRATECLQQGAVAVVTARGPADGRPGSIGLR